MSKRIDEIVKCIKYKTVGDIATDHCFIGIKASEKEGVKKVIGCDINNEPLENGRRNIIKRGIKNIELRIGDGIKPIEKGEIETVIIAGIGGSLMIKILEESVDKVKEMKQLILQPQSAVIKVKKYIHSIGFKITEEIIVEENKIYTILDVSKGYEKYSEKEYLLGRNIVKNEHYKNHLKFEISKKKMLISEMEKAKKNEHVEKHIEQCKNEIEIYESAYERR